MPLCCQGPPVAGIWPLLVSWSFLKCFVAKKSAAAACYCSSGEVPGLAPALVVGSEKMLKRRWNGQVHGKEFRGRLSPRDKVEAAERSEEMSGGGKGWQTALNSWTCSCAQIQNHNPPLPHAPRAQQSWGSNLSTHQGCAFRRAMRIKGEAGVAWCHTSGWGPCCEENLSNKRAFYLLKHPHCPAITVWYFSLATCAGATLFQYIHVFPQPFSRSWRSSVALCLWEQWVGWAHTIHAC